LIKTFVKDFTYL